MTSTDPQAIHSLYLSAIERFPGTVDAWMRNGTWTPIATAALVEVALSLFPPEVATRLTAKGHIDGQGQSELLTLDVCAWDEQQPWQSPLFVAEIESKGSLEEVQYSAWKLLSVDSRVRVLLTYFGESFRWTLEELRAAVSEVCRAQPGKELVLLPVRSADTSSPEEIREMHARAELIVG